MILAHHAGEEAVFAALAAGGTSVLSGVAIFGRARLGALLRWLLRR
ncbi:MAG: hypothetical protein ACRDON_11975 [Gaiellaceae bacterium]